MRNPTQFRRGVGRVFAVMVAATLASGMVATNREEHTRDGERGFASSSGSWAADSVSPLIDYLNAVGTATAAAEP